MDNIIPIPSLVPETSAPPPNNAISGIVTLSWPYSSSTKSCALLIADRDFRLRSRKGQVRVRFSGPSAAAVAKAHIGIGDEILLALGDGRWIEEDTNVVGRTPGRSVGMELEFGGKLGLKIARKSGDVDIHVDEPVVAEKKIEKIMEAVMATPVPKPVQKIRKTAGVGMPVYSSPAFAKRLRLSGEQFLDSAYDPFADEDLDVERTKKKQRTSFGGNWRYADKSPSPPATSPPATSPPASLFLPTLAPQAQVEPSTQTMPTSSILSSASTDTAMLPPAAPRFETSDRSAIEMEIDRPTTPKIQPVSSAALPLPSPFPDENKQILFGSQAFNSDLIPVAEEDVNEEMSDEVESERPEATADPVPEGFYNQPGPDVVPGPSIHTDNQTLPRKEPEVVDLEDSDDEPEEVPTVEDESESDSDVAEISEIADTSAPVEIPSPNATPRDDPETASHQMDKTPDEEVPSRMQVEESITRPRTPPRPSSYGLDGAQSSPATAPKSTPQSQKEKVMKQTFQSLFGFAASSDESQGEEEEPGSPTPAAPINESHQMDVMQDFSKDVPEEKQPDEGITQPQPPVPAAPEVVEVVDIDSDNEENDDEVSSEAESESDEESAEEDTAVVTQLEQDLTAPSFPIDALFGGSGSTGQIPVNDDAGASMFDQLMSYDPLDPALMQEFGEVPMETVQQEGGVVASEYNNERATEGVSARIHEEVSEAQQKATLSTEEGATTTLEHVDPQSSNFTANQSTLRPLQPVESGPAVIDLLSPEEEMHVPESAARKADADIFDQFLSTGHASTIPEEVIVEETEPQKVTGQVTYPDLPGTESEEAAGQVPYPTLPMSPSNSQTLQENVHNLRNGAPETTTTARLPPTPQLTGTGSNLQIPEPASSMEQTTPARRSNRKSLAARLSHMPDVLSNWFSPKREKRKHSKGHTTEHKPVIKSLRTPLAYFTPLSSLDENLNPASSQGKGNVVDVLAVICDKTSAPVRAKPGPRDFFTIFRVQDTSLEIDSDIRVEVFRPWKATLPTAEVGDIILLRSFVVRSKKRKSYLLSNDASAWCVWRFADAVETADNSELEKEKPAWARRRLSNGANSGEVIFEETKGPPVELGEEERRHAKDLRTWWLQVSESSNDE